MHGHGALNRTPYNGCPNHPKSPDDHPYCVQGVSPRKQPKGRLHLPIFIHPGFDCDSPHLFMGQMGFFIGPYLPRFDCVSPDHPKVQPQEKAGLADSDPLQMLYTGTRLKERQPTRLWAEQLLHIVWQWLKPHLSGFSAPSYAPFLGPNSPWLANSKRVDADIFSTLLGPKTGAPGSASASCSSISASSRSLCCSS